MVQFYIHEYSRYKTGKLHEYSGIYTMNILELFQNIHELFMFKKAGQDQKLKTVLPSAWYIVSSERLEEQGIQLANLGSLTTSPQSLLEVIEAPRRNMIKTQYSRPSLHDY